MLYNSQGSILRGARIMPKVNCLNFDFGLITFLSDPSNLG